MVRDYLPAERPHARSLARLVRDGASEADRSASRPFHRGARHARSARTAVQGRDGRRHERQGLVRRDARKHLLARRLRRRNLHLAASVAVQRAHSHRRRRCGRWRARRGIRGRRAGARRGHAVVFRGVVRRRAGRVSPPRPRCRHSRGGHGRTPRRDQCARHGLRHDRQHRSRSSRVARRDACRDRRGEGRNRAAAASRS